MRIASLVPSATEMLFELGLGDQVVGVTHECDWPPQATTLPHLTSSVIPEGLAEREIDEAVRSTVAEGRALYELDEATLERLDVDLIVTQAVCEVCAVSYDDVVAIAGTLANQPRVVSLDPSNLAEVIADIERLGAATECEPAARELAETARRRIATVEARVARLARPTVLALEWLDPPFIGGHWVPEMIELAGGHDLLGTPGQKSRQMDWPELAGMQVDIVLLIPCGYDTTRAAQEAQTYSTQLSTLKADRVVATDAAAYFSRPGPRLIDGVELLAQLFHPGQAGSVPPNSYREIY